MRKRTYILYVRDNSGLNKIGTADEQGYDSLDKQCKSRRDNGENAFIWEI